MGVSLTQYSARIKPKVLSDGFNPTQGQIVPSNSGQTTPAKFYAPNFTFARGDEWAFRGQPGVCGRSGC